jgi:hypothetical protein
MIAFGDTDLASFKWKNWVLVLLALSDNDTQFKKEQSIDAAAAADFSERDLHPKGFEVQKSHDNGHVIKARRRVGGNWAPSLH